MERGTTDDAPPISRRTLLRTTGLAMGSAWVASTKVSARTQAPGAVLDPAEYRTLDAVCARIIPADENGPGAREALAVRFIDHGLAGALESSLDQYREGLRALDAYARSTHGEDFAALAESDQDAVLEAVEDGRAAGFDNSARFFNMVRTHTIQGTFSDPVYGGNRDFIGWDMIGYPGVRVAVPERFQLMDEDHSPNHVSAYDSAMFNPPPDALETED